MSELPLGWVETTLGEIGHVQSGVGFPLEAQGDTDGEYPVYKVGDVSRGVLTDGGELRRSTNYVSAATAAALKGHIFPVGSVLFAKIGEALRLNRRAIVRKEGLADNNVMGFKSHPETDDSFVYYFLRTQDLAALSRSTTIPSIRKGDVEQVALTLPPSAEQKRIAQKLDALLAQVDTLKARIDAIPALLKRFRLAVLSAATRGLLTESWRTSRSGAEERRCESAQSFLERILEERRLHPRVKFKPPLDPDMDTRNIVVPEGWAVASVSQFAECLDSMRVPVKKELRVNGVGRYPYFGANGEVDRVDEFIFDDELVLVTEDETFYGRVKPIAYQYSGKCWVNNHVHALRAHDKVGQSFLCYTLMYYDVIPWLTGTTGRAKLTQGALMALPIGVPSPGEQSEIVRRVEQLFAFAGQLEAKVATAKQRIDRLTQSLLAKAFRGELVPQDPNDEPAIVLLKRIRANTSKTCSKQTRKSSI